MHINRYTAYTVYNLLQQNQIKIVNHLKIARYMLCTLIIYFAHYCLHCDQIKIVNHLKLYGIYFAHYSLHCEIYCLHCVQFVTTRSNENCKSFKTVRYMLCILIDILLTLCTICYNKIKLKL